MVISEIRALYNDENDLLRTVVKRIYEDYDPERKRWKLGLGTPRFRRLSLSPSYLRVGGR